MLALVLLFQIFLGSRAASDNPYQCGTVNDEGDVYTVTDGTLTRCFSVFTPPSSRTGQRLPILFWFHGSGGNARNCGAQKGPDDEYNMQQLAYLHGFAFVCGEALQTNDHKGQWDIPEVITDDISGCENGTSVDQVYMQNVLQKLEDLGSYDTTKVFTSGCSMGSAFSQYAASCMKHSNVDMISAYATHSTGLKTKGDGTRLPREWHNPSYTWGECPKCQYFPQRPQTYEGDTLGFKACIFDNTGDRDFYKTSQFLAQKWDDLGMKYETTFLDGGHCQIHSYTDIAKCLDDGTSRLFGNTQKKKFN